MKDINKILKALKKKEDNSVSLLSERKGMEVPYWIPTGSLWLDNIICVGKTGGIPGGHITEIAGLPASGKSYLAAQILKNAQAMDKIGVWFDSENSMDASFLEKMGVNLDDVVYVTAKSIEQVFESMESILRDVEDVFFVWDSVANTPAQAEWDKSFDPSSVIGLQARALSFGLRRITNLLGTKKSTLLILNQLKTNIGPLAMVEPFVTPCGKAIQFNAHLRLFLVARSGKTHNIYLNDEKIGSDLIVKIRKSRFGTEERKCELKILWGDGVRICDEDSWIHVVQNSPYYERKRGVHVIYMDNEKTRSVSVPVNDWIARIMEEGELRERVKSIMYEELVEKFESKHYETPVVYSEVEDGVEEYGHVDGDDGYDG